MMKARQKLPIGVQNFEKLRRDGYLYIDKTELIYRLATEGTYYFLSRPRRFGKSLLMSTIHALFEGKKELFDGTIGKRLAIADKKDVSWEAHPVLHLDLNTNKYTSADVLTTKISFALDQWEAEYGCEDKNIPLGMRFENVIRAAAQKTGRRTVILVDEYDKPMLQALNNADLLDDYRATLKGFYGALKSMDGYIQFALLTGVTKFSKVSVFSDLNNLMDISMSRAYYNICGMTEEEMLAYFPNEIDNLAEENDMTRDECIAQLKLRYDGYHFHHLVPGMYNPFSLLNTFQNSEFGSYWFATGTPTYLVELLKRHNYPLRNLVGCKTTAKVLDSIDPNSTSPIPVIFQSGYLTIKSYDPRFKMYELGFPNQEVEEGFVDYLMPFYTPINEVDSPFYIQQFVREVENGDTEGFVKRLRSLFADTPYELVKDLENHYQNVLWIVTKLMGLYTQAEYHTSEGRIDLVIQTPKYCYVLEFKLDGTAEEALAQIKDKSYSLPFEMNGQKIIRIGMNFSSQTRNIEKYIVE